MHFLIVGNKPPGDFLAPIVHDLGGFSLGRFFDVSALSVLRFRCCVLQGRAALAVANLVGQEESHPAFQQTGTEQLASTLVGMLSAALQGRTYGGSVGNSIWHPTAWKVAQGLGFLAKADVTKKPLLEAGLFPYLIKAIQRGAGLDSASHDDKLLITHCLAALWQLCFLKETQAQLREQPDILALLRDMSQSTLSGIAEIKKNASGVLWMLQRETAERENAAKLTRQQESKVKGHIMISVRISNPQRVTVSPVGSQ
eukprot:m.68638 g.68638  ORF g.68638 m.68638 type:complete len:256 (+) comp13917_c0_seq6:648-1415(+)